MRSPIRSRHSGLFWSLSLLAFLAAAPASPSGFQIMTHGARATGMGLAFAAVADGPSAIFYNPAGLGWQQHFSSELGSSLITKVEGDFEGSSPFPGAGVRETQHETTFVVPTFYAVLPLTADINLGLGVFAPYGLGFRWNDAETFSGRFISQNAVVQTTDINPVVSWRVLPQLAIAVGADYRASGVQLERNNATFNPFTQAFVDTAHVKLKSELLDNTAWGWNAGILFKPVPAFAIGAAYRSAIQIDYEGEARFTQRPTGNAAFDALVASRLPTGKQEVRTSIEFPASANLGVAVTLPGALTISVEADWTGWSSFDRLDIDFENAAIPDLERVTAWEDSWAYRVGVEKKFRSFALRAGYYRDNTPQPLEDAGPLLADNDRDAYTVGFGIGTDRWGIDVSDLYLKVKDFDTTGRSNDGFFGKYKESVNILAASFRVAF